MSQMFAQTGANTAYGDAYGYNERNGRNFDQAAATRTYYNPGMDARRTMAATQRPQSSGMPAPQGMSHEARSSSNALNGNVSYNFAQTLPPQQESFQVRSTNRFPPRVEVPSKTEFYPAGTRVSYAKTRKTFPRNADLLPQPAREPRINFNGMTESQFESSQNFGKQSISRRLPEQHKLRYHVPGYMGFVRDMQYHHGRSYGKITRECIMKDHL